MNGSAPRIFIVTVGARLVPFFFFFFFFFFFTLLAAH